MWLPYSRKFSPGENFCLFRPSASWVKFFLANYFTQWKFCHSEIFTRTDFTRGCQAVLVVRHDRQSAGIQTHIFLNLQSNLMSLLFYPILSDPYRRSYLLPPSQRPTLLWTACSKRRLREVRSEGRTGRSTVCWGSRACEYGTRYIGRGVFIRELHPLLPGEQLALWAKLNSAKFLW